MLRTDELLVTSYELYCEFIWSVFLEIKQWFVEQARYLFKSEIAIEKIAPWGVIKTLSNIQHGDFHEIVNDLTIITKSSILDVSQSSDYARLWNHSTYDKFLRLLRQWYYKLCRFDSKIFLKTISVTASYLMKTNMITCVTLTSISHYAARVGDNKVQ